MMYIGLTLSGMNTDQIASKLLVMRTGENNPKRCCITEQFARKL
jgi:hypothetical protein